jgi:DNA anti-recombination protein RmuC
MENLTIFKRLNTQVDAVLAALQAAKEEIAGLRTELVDCRAQCEQNEQQIKLLQDAIHQNDAEMEQLASRIAEVLDNAGREAERAPLLQEYS